MFSTLEKSPKIQKEFHYQILCSECNICLSFPKISWISKNVCTCQKLFPLSFFCSQYLINIRVFIKCSGISKFFLLKNHFYFIFWKFEKLFEFFNKLSDFQTLFVVKKTQFPNKDRKNSKTCSDSPFKLVLIRSRSNFYTKVVSSTG